MSQEPPWLGRAPFLEQASNNNDRLSEFQWLQEQERNNEFQNTTPQLRRRALSKLLDLNDMKRVFDANEGYFVNKLKNRENTSSLFRHISDTVVNHMTNNFMDDRFTIDENNNNPDVMIYRVMKNALNEHTIRMDDFFRRNIDNQAVLEQFAEMNFPRSRHDILDYAEEVIQIPIPNEHLDGLMPWNPNENQRPYPSRPPFTRLD